MFQTSRETKEREEHMERRFEITKDYFYWPNDPHNFISIKYLRIFHSLTNGRMCCASVSCAANSLWDEVQNSWSKADLRLSSLPLCFMMNMSFYTLKLLCDQGERGASGLDGRSGLDGKPGVPGSPGQRVRQFFSLTIMYLTYKLYWLGDGASVLLMYFFTCHRVILGNKAILGEMWVFCLVVSKFKWPDCVKLKDPYFCP